MLKGWSVTRWIQRLQQGDHIPGKDDVRFLVYPINIKNSHWLFAWVDRENKRVTVYDSYQPSTKVRLLHVVVRTPCSQLFPTVVATTTFLQGWGQLPRKFKVC